MKKSTNSALLTALQVVMLVFPAAAHGQTLRFGVVGLYQFSDKFFQKSSYTDAKLLGPSVEVRLPHQLAVEGNLLYQRNFSVKYESSSYGGTSGKTTDTYNLNIHAFEVPVLLQWQGLNRVKGLFVGGGIVFRNLSGTREDTMTFTRYCFATSGCPPSTPAVTYSKSPASDLPNHFTVGAAVASGMDIRVSALRIRPQFRYIRWNNAIAYYDTGPNTIQVLVGVAYEKRFQH